MIFISIKCWLEIYPLKLNNRVGIDPFWRYFSIEAKLFNFNGSEFIDRFCSCGIQEHTNFEVVWHVLNVLKKFFTLWSPIRFAFISCNFVIFLFHFLSRIGHLNHNFLQFLHFNNMNILHSFMCFFLFLIFSLWTIS